jgi:putative FmdB family regulatory protein
MPLYEYECRQCHRRTEKIQKFSDPELTTCPHCAGPLERTITAAAVSFKGGGWYKDGYASRPSASGDSKSAESKSGDSNASDSKSSSSDSPSTTSAPKSESSSPAPAPAAAPSSTSPKS